MGGLWFAPEKDESVPGDHRKTYLQLREELKKEGFKVQPDKESTLKRCQVRFAPYQCHVMSCNMQDDKCLSYTFKTGEEGRRHYCLVHDKMGQYYLVRFPD